MLLDLLLLGLRVLMGERGAEWDYYIDCDAYWHIWAYANRN